MVHKRVMCDLAGDGMRGRTGRLCAVSLVVVASAVLASPVSAARHNFRWGDSTDPASVSGYVDTAGPVHVGVDVHPERLGGQRLPLQPPVAVPAPPRPDQLPTVEAPGSETVHLPDLAPAPAWGVYLDESIPDVALGDLLLSYVDGSDPYAGSRKAIRFGTTIWNRGKHSLEIVGAPRPTGDAGDPVRVQAQQCVRFAGPRVDGAERMCQAYEPVGSLLFHPQHGHFHIDGFAQYRLLRDRGGKPDTGPGGVVSRSEKVGFCMADTDWHGYLDTGWYRECRHTTPHFPVTARQGVSPGWGDSYGPALPGQHLVIDKVPDGVYWIAITVNPLEFKHLVNLRETTRTNNTSYRRVQISKNGNAVKAL